MMQWRNLVIKKTPKENVNEVHACESSSKDALNAKELWKREKWKQNVFIRGMQEEESKNALWCSSTLKVGNMKLSIYLKILATL